MPSSNTDFPTSFTQSLLDKYGPIMDLVDLAEALHVTKAGLYKQISDGHFSIPHFKNGKKYLFFTVEVGEHFLNKRGAA